MKLKRNDLIAQMEKGCKKRRDFRIGVEHEKFGFHKETLKPIGYGDIVRIFEGFMAEGWKGQEEGGKTVALARGGATITLEPGGQFELSSAPLGTLHETQKGLDEHILALKKIAEPLDIGFLPIGFAPHWRLSDMPHMPKKRYEYMRAIMPKTGGRGLDMMYRTATVQVNLDYESEGDMVLKMRTALSLQPIVSTIFANAPFYEGAPSAQVSERVGCWLDVDGARGGASPFIFDEGAGFASYIDWALRAPLYFVIRDGEFLSGAGWFFADFMEGKLPGLEGVYADMGDWDIHLTTLFPEIRLKTFLEMRGADMVPQKYVNALPALWVGLLYEPQILEEAWALCSEWGGEKRAALLRDASSQKLQGMVGALAGEMVGLAKRGLQKRGLGEEGYLAPLEGIIDEGKTLSEKLLEKYYGEWGESVLPIFREYGL